MTDYERKLRQWRIASWGMPIALAAVLLVVLWRVEANTGFSQALRFAAFGIPIIALAILRTLYFWWMERYCAAWPTAPATITGSKTDFRSMRYGHRVDLTYTYSAAGRSYTGRFCENYDFLFFDDKAFSAQFPVGADATVRYDPQDPSHTVLAGTEAFVKGKLGNLILAAVVSAGVIALMYFDRSLR